MITVVYARRNFTLRLLHLTFKIQFIFATEILIWRLKFYLTLKQKYDCNHFKINYLKTHKSVFHSLYVKFYFLTRWSSKRNSRKWLKVLLRYLNLLKFLFCNVRSLLWFYFYITWWRNLVNFFHSSDPFPLQFFSNATLPTFEHEYELWHGHMSTLCPNH